jgi:hypothetical protein
MLIGVGLVLGSAALGAQLFTAADHTVPTWAAGNDLPAGGPLAEQDLVEVPVRLEAATNPYLTGPVPEGYVLVRPVAAGELVPASAVAPAASVDEPTRLVAVAVPGAATPASIARGDRVDVWEVPDTRDGAPTDAALLAPGVQVAATDTADGGFAGSAGDRSVVLAVTAAGRSPAEFDAVVARLVAASAAGRVVLTLDPGPR